MFRAEEAGVRQRTAEVLISEIGVDMTIFVTPKHENKRVVSRPQGRGSPHVDIGPARLRIGKHRRQTVVAESLIANASLTADIRSAAPQRALRRLKGRANRSSHPIGRRGVNHQNEGVLVGTEDQPP